MPRALLLVEALVLFGGGPLLVLAIKLRLIFVLMLWAGALVAWRVTRADPAPVIDRRRELAAIGRRALVIVPALTLATVLLRPDLFLAFPRDHMWLWLAVMIAYPVLSVWPQEMIYRRFFLRRYSPLFGDGAGVVAASALAFGYAHVIFLNPVAPTLTALGGLIFAAAYARHRSLALVCLEHALYGCVIFTIGLGRFFFTGFAWHP